MSSPTKPQPSSGRPPQSVSGEADHRNIPVIEEQVKIDKAVVETGTVQVTKAVHDEKVQVDVPLSYDVTDIRRLEVNRFVDTAPAVRQEGDTTIIPVLREVLVKRLLLVEEIHLTKIEQQNHAQQEVTLRREEVKVERKTK